MVIRKSVLIIVIALVALVAYGFLFHREMVMGWIDSSRGYGKATTPQECIDYFKKAVENRNYKMAAKYCTKDYAELLKKAHDAAKELGQSIDDLTYRMKNDGVLTTEVAFVLFINDPLPPYLKMQILSSGDTEATASVAVDNPDLPTQPTKTWEYDRAFIKALYHDLILRQVRLVKEDDVWKIDFPVNPAVRDRVDRLNRRYKDYVNAFKKMAEEVRIERTTKAEVATRLNELLSDAVRAPQ